MAAAPPAPALIDELVEEILLRLPPSEPGSLVRAALACKPWCRLISGARFRRRFREFHRAPPMLGFIYNRIDDWDDYVARFVPTCSFRPPGPHADRRGWRAVDARHGRVLLRSTSVLEPPRLVVWNPMTDEWRQLPSLPKEWQDMYDWNAAVLCAAAGGACDHLDCHDGPFLIVLLSSGIDEDDMTLQVYSSQACAWSEPDHVAQYPKFGVEMVAPTIVRNALYFVVDWGTRIISYDLSTWQMSAILQPPDSFGKFAVIVTMEDGGLGVAITEAARLSLWSMQSSTAGGKEWAQIRVIALDKLLSVHASSIWSEAVVFAHGVGVFFVLTDDGIFSFHLNSGRVRKVCEKACSDNGIPGVIPYLSFYTPALGAVCPVNNQD